ncbi:Diphosphomevalonate decarboxylase [Suillus lakei]|nr:Diphosphomevalonate decarboxylase [Suillus lakei]
MSVYQATTSAPVNIACIKYWGKRNESLILPTNSSLSVTLSQDNLRSTTTARADPSFTADCLWLNGKVDPIKAGGRLHTCISEMKRLRAAFEAAKSQSTKGIASFNVHICSFNNFPTAAGLASSASGFAALTPEELSLIARRGSGSACRSLFGGFVAWDMGSDDATGLDSKARQVAPESHWPEMEALICVVNDAKKGTSSTSGMQRTVVTSALLQHRIGSVVPSRMADIESAIADKRFGDFAEITMRDSNQFHAVALDTYPPIFYMNDVSRAIIAIITEYNRLSEQPKAAYTYDAGPNAVIYALTPNVREIAQLVLYYFPQAEKVVIGGQEVQAALPEGFNEAVAKRWEVGSVKGLIHTRVGDGPRVLSDSEALLNALGIPKTLA